ncbi:hypothetical protein Pcinc_032071 [Petrolisthes cinctipes]|uniref:Uncharacterized protein n=1 Tax=Petrolisthes cinctipes TaxID=88211 RepID=A0AAE1K3X9_PETCI|nr:hypothetical protein Pcinc_032071 [Petrolisthes cinctipes]
MTICLVVKGNFDDRTVAHSLANIAKSRTEDVECGLKPTITRPRGRATGSVIETVAVNTCLHLMSLCRFPLPMLLSCAWISWRLIVYREINEELLNRGRVTRVLDKLFAKCERIN